MMFSFFSSVYTQETKSCLCPPKTQMLHSSFIRNSLKLETTQMSSRMSGNKLVYHTMEYCTALKKNRQLAHTNDGWILKTLYQVKETNHKTAIKVIPVIYMIFKNRQNWSAVIVNVTLGSIDWEGPHKGLLGCCKCCIFWSGQWLDKYIHV